MKIPTKFELCVQDFFTPPVPKYVFVRAIHPEKVFVKFLFEISEKAQKSLITLLPAGRQGLKTDYTDMKYKRAYSKFSELPKKWPLRAIPPSFIPRGYLLTLDPLKPRPLEPLLLNRKRPHLRDSIPIYPIPGLDSQIGGFWFNHFFA